MSGRADAQLDSSLNSNPTHNRDRFLFNMRQCSRNSQGPSGRRAAQSFWSKPMVHCVSVALFATLSKIGQQIGSGWLIMKDATRAASQSRRSAFN